MNTLSTTRLPYAAGRSRRYGHHMRRGALFFAVAAAVAAVHPASAQPSGDDAVLEEIVVTATRRAQNLQEVALSVTALTGQQLDELKLFEFDDFAAVTPGLAMTSTAREPGVIAVRGIGFAPNSSAPPAVDVYINELPVDAVYVFNSLFDVQQMELLRGPQGTLRGRPAPAGAVTVITRRPDLNDVGGTVSASFSDADAQNLQAALNVPLVQDKLALRVAAIRNVNEGPGGRTLAGDEQEVDDEGVRATVLFEPVENLSFLFTHHQMDRDVERFDFVQGPGAGYNGPALSASDRRSVVEGIGTQEQDIALTSLQASWEGAGHRLVYIGGYQDLKNRFASDLDVGNAIVDHLQLQQVRTDFEVTSHELRLESAGERRVDYNLGLWYSDTETDTKLHQSAELTGAFGIPAVPRGPAVQEYLLGLDIRIPAGAENKAVFGHLDFHVNDRLDIGVGARYLEEESDRSETFVFAPFLNPAPITPGVPLDNLASGLCPTILNSVAPAPAGPGSEWVREFYTGYCDIRIALPSTFTPAGDTYKEWVYDASVKYRVSDDVMVYFTAAHSWRPPGITVGITADVPDDLVFGAPEESDAFELGIKSEWLVRRLRLNAALFHQSFEGFIGRFEDVPYLDTNTQTVSEGGFTYNADAIAYGFEADVFWMITPDWTTQFMFSTQKGEYDDAEVPCRDSDFDGKSDNGSNPPVAAWPQGTVVAFCRSDDAISNLPDWNATLQSEYVMPRDTVEYYLRGLLNYQPDNDNFSTGFERKAYTMLNLYAGVRSSDGVWDVTLWAKNALDEDTLLQLDSDATLAEFSSGYRGVSVLPERELGLSVRYAFGGG